MRTVTLSARFKRERDRLAPAGSNEAWALAATLRALKDERQPLPGIADHLVELPFAVMGRSVHGTSLVIAYMPLGDHVEVVALVQA